MGQPYNHARDRIPVRYLSAISVCALFALMIKSTFLMALELEELSVTEIDGEYRLHFVSVLDANMDYVYKVITDYKNAYRISPSITKVEILPSVRDEVIRVKNLSEHWVGPFCFSLKWVGDIIERRHGHLEIKTIPEYSSFDAGFSTWDLQPQGNRTLVSYNSNMKPDFFIPPLIGKHIVKSYIERDALNTFARIECFAKIQLDIDMENETEPMSNVLADGKHCLNSQS